MLKTWEWPADEAMQNDHGYSDYQTGQNNYHDFVLLTWSTCTYYIANCDRPLQNQPYCTDNHFWDKATIANYNLWTGASANLSL